MAQPIAEWATSPDRAVTVLAAPGGLPLQVEFSPNALRQPPDALARVVLATATQAGRRATRRLHRELAATIGPEANHTMDTVGLSVSGDGDEPDGDQPDGDSDFGDFGGVLRRPR